MDTNYCSTCNQPFGVRKRCYKCEAISKWKPKPYLDKASGYLRIRLPIRGKQMFFHRWLMEQHLGRPLVWPEVVHHLNHDKLDNRLENLQLTTAAKHMSVHKTGQNKAKLGWANKYIMCKECGRNDKPHIGVGLCSICYSRRYEKTRPKCRWRHGKRIKLSE